MKRKIEEAILSLCPQIIKKFGEDKASAKCFADALLMHYGGVKYGAKGHRYNDARSKVYIATLNFRSRTFDGSEIVEVVPIGSTGGCRYISTTVFPE